MRSVDETASRPGFSCPFSFKQGGGEMKPFACAVLFFGLAVATAGSAASKTVEVSGVRCIDRLTYDASQFSESEIRNAYEIFTFGSPVSVVHVLTHEEPNRFRSMSALEKELAEERAKLTTFKGLKVPVKVEPYRKKLVNDANFAIWASETLVNYAKTKDRNLLRTPFEGWDQNKVCGDTLAPLDGVTKENSRLALAALKKACGDPRPDFNADGCFKNYEQKFEKFTTPVQEAPYVVFIWYNCVNGNYQRFSEGKRAIRELNLKIESFDCDHSD